MYKLELEVEDTYKKSGFNYLPWELVTVLAIWVVSLLLSYYPFNSALDRSDWITAHSLLSLRALDQWGAFYLFGASSLTPHSYEMQGADLTTFTKTQGIYLSYPSLWLIFPYMVFKAVSIFSPNYELNPAFIIVYNLVVNRLLCGIVVYFTFRYLLDYLFHDSLFYVKLGSIGQRILAVIGLAGWMLPASSMLNTQNLYFSDQAVLLPIYCLFLFTLKHKFDFWNLRWLDRLILGILSLISVGIDWYGLVFIAVLFGSVAVLTYLNHSDENRLKIVRKTFLNLGMPLACGVSIMLAFYLCQLIYFEDGFKQVIDIFILRTGEKAESTKNTLSFLEIYSGVIEHWKGYLPKVDRLIMLALQEFLNLPETISILLFVFAPVFLWLSTSKARKNPNNFAALSLLYLAPCIQLLLLKQHSYVHGFSAFKMALPISFSTCIMPAAYAVYITSQLDRISITVRSVVLVVILSIFILPFALKFPSGDYLEFSENKNSLFKDIGEFVRRDLPSDAIIFSDSLLKTDLDDTGWLPQFLWYSNRFLYSQKTFALEKPKLQKNRVDGVKFIFIDYENAVGQGRIEPRIAKLCAGKWLHYPTPIINGRKIVSCDTQELKMLLLN